MTNRPVTQQLVALFGQPGCQNVNSTVQPNSRQTLPTAEAYGEWQRLYTYLNERLFGGALPQPLITLNRKRGALGYFRPDAFQDLAGTVACEIAMNPDWFDAAGDAESFGTLAHEMAHLARFVLDRPNRKGGRGARGYHDKAWGKRMIAIGLMPSHTGRPGGRRTGYRMSHYVIENGPFDLACRELLIAGERINWRDARARFTPSPGSPDAPAEAQPARNTRKRFVCPLCDVKAWSRASAKLACTACDKSLIAR